MNFTLKDVSEKAKVSIATVSRVLNNNEYNVTSATRNKVFDAIREMGYSKEQIDEMVEEIKATKKPIDPAKTIGCILSDESKFYDHYYSVILKEIAAEVSRQGYSLYYMYTHNNLKDMLLFQNTILNNEVSNFIFVGWSVDEKLFSESCKEIKNLVCVNGTESMRNLGRDIITVDLAEGAYKATKHLLSLGHRDIGFIGGISKYITYKDVESFKTEGRYIGFEKAMIEQGLKPDDEFIRNSEWTLKGSYEAVIDLLSSKRLPTALFVASDTMALGALRAIQDKGLRIPDDIAIVGFDNIEMAQYSSPPLTTIDVDKKQLAKLSVRTLIDRIDGELNMPIEIFLQPQLIVRESCGAVKKSELVKEDIAENV
jgi:DNA-binding LacI/PurR family transcriptional regulator